MEEVVVVKDSWNVGVSLLLDILVWWDGEAGT